jgi:hypothetical protein
MALMSGVTPANSLTAHANRSATAATSPEEIARQFYRWFFKAGSPEPSKHQAQFRRYVTQACLRRAINADDYVYFTQAQDGEPSWGTHITASKIATSAQRVVVSVTLGTPATANKLKVELVRERGVWKIDKVKAAEDR